MDEVRTDRSLLLFALLLISCVRAPPVGPAIARTAASWVGEDALPGDDCLDLARAAWKAHGVSVPSGPSLFAALSSAGSIRGGTPGPGDLVFFRDPAADASAPPSHAGVIERTGDDGTLLVVHRLRGGVARLRMNLAHPGTLRDPHSGLRWNDALRSGGTQRTLAQLYAGRAAAVVSAATGDGRPPRWPPPWPGRAHPAR